MTLYFYTGNITRFKLTRDSFGHEQLMEQRLRVATREAVGAWIDVATFAAVAVEDEPKPIGDNGGSSTEFPITLVPQRKFIVHCYSCNDVGCDDCFDRE